MSEPDAEVIIELTAHNRIVLFLASIMMFKSLVKLNIEKATILLRLFSLLWTM